MRSDSAEEGKPFPQLVNTSVTSDLTQTGDLLKRLWPLIPQIPTSLKSVQLMTKRAPARPSRWCHLEFFDAIGGDLSRLRLGYCHASQGRRVTEGINTKSSGSTDVYLPCFLNLDSRTEIRLIMSAITAQIGWACYQPAYCVCFTSGQAGKRLQRSDGNDRLIVTHASSNGPD